MLQLIMEETRADEISCHFSDSKNNFRFQIFPDYKAGRPPKPKWQPWIREYIQNTYPSVLVDRHEADDSLAMYQNENTICCSIDKDLLQIPGQHYNWVSKEWNYIEEFEGLKWFYRQIMMGDKTDNLTGLWRYGPAKTLGLVSGCEFEEELWDVVVDSYSDTGTDLSIALRNARCMWCYRLPVGDDLRNIWNPPNTQR
jgi:5'-3' exonuclease